MRRVLLGAVALAFLVGAIALPAAAKNKPPPPILYPPGVTGPATDGNTPSMGPTYVITPGGTSTVLPPPITDPADLPSGLPTPTGTGTDAVPGPGSSTPTDGSGALAGAQTPLSPASAHDQGSVPVWAIGAGAGLLIALGGVGWRLVASRRSNRGAHAEA